MAVELSRPDLMTLARQFVDRIGQKLQGGDSVRSNLDQIPDGELLLLQPRLPNNVLVAASVAGLTQNSKLFLSFREFCDGLAFPIDVNTETATASGWYLKEENNFFMDLRNGVVQSRGAQYRVNSSDWFAKDGEIFIAADAIANWMLIETNVITESLLLDLVADVPFPLEDRLKRRKRRLNTTEISAVPELPRTSPETRLIGMPNANISIGASYRKSPSTDASKDQNATVNAVNEVMGHTVRTLATFGPGTNLEGLRVTAEKQVETDTLLGPLQARRYELGDIDTTPLTIAGDNEEGFGARVTNALDGEIAGSTKRTFEGDIPPDWDIELYDGTQLIAFQTSGVDGRYQFDDIDLYAGENDFRLVFYGPQGEVREETVTIPVDLAAVGQDKKLYDVSLTLNNVATYDIIPQEDEDKWQPHVVVSYQQGLRDGLSMNAGMRSRSVDGERVTVATGGVVARLGSTLLNATAATDDELNTAFEGVMRQTFGKHSLRSTTYIATRGYNPDRADVTNIWQSSLDMRGPIAKLFGQEFSYTIDTNASKNTDGDETRRASVGQSGRIGQYVVGHVLEYTSTKTDDDTTDRLASALSLRRSIGQTRIVASTRYTYAPDPLWQSLSLSF